MRASSVFFYTLLSEIVLLAGFLFHASITANVQQPHLQEKMSLIQNLQLTDLCLFTEARYTRHLSQADLNTAFQDHPLSLEHFPSGSFTQPTFTGISP